MFGDGVTEVIDLWKQTCGQFTKDDPNNPGTHSDEDFQCLVKQFGFPTS
jgi:hypothetical protein